MRLMKFSFQKKLCRTLSLQRKGRLDPGQSGQRGIVRQKLRTKETATSSGGLLKVCEGAG